MLSVVHRVSIPAPHTHIVHVETTITGTLPETIVLFMPVWTPGSYLVREYARHVEGLAADPPAHVSKIRKNAWLVRTGGTPRVRVHYLVYAGELSVRTNHVDESHAFLVGAGLFLGVEGHELAPLRIEIVVPDGWSVATPLPE